MGIFGKKRDRAAVESSASTTFPTVSLSDADRLGAVIDKALSAQTIGDLEGPVRALIDMSDSIGYDPNRSIWTWFGAWVAQAPSTNTEVVAAKIAMFYMEWFDSVRPQAPQVGMVLGDATPDQKAAIENGAFDACGNLPPDLVVMGDGHTTARKVHTLLSERLGRPITAAAASVPSATDTLNEAIEDAQSGDDVKGLMLAAVVAQSEGNLDGAYDLLSQAARLGDTEAMTQAGVLASQLGKHDESRFWAETAAAAGDPVALFNLGIISLESGQMQDATSYFLRAAEAGNHEGYAALIEVSERQGDEASARRYAAAGAEHDNPRCLQMHANFLMQSNPDNFDAFLPLLERSAGFGNVHAMFQAGIVCNHIGNRVQAAHWLRSAQSAGHPDASTKLMEYGLG